MISLLLTIIAAYMLGAVPSSVWIGKVFFKKDIRQHGSGNAGATNTFRVLGVFPGIIVLILDIAKGFAAVNLSGFSEISHSDLPLILGLVAIFGHAFSVFLKFKGGKGVATSLGVAIAAAPVPVSITVGLFLVVLVSSRMVSLSSLVAATSFALLTSFVFETTTGIIIFSWLVAFFIWFTHRSNIQRIINGAESKVNFGFGSKS
jgi:glycerol-3-phosphate acyltransferase PlsY